MEEYVHFLGYCGDISAVLQASDIFVLPSVGEAFGYVFTEAMATGVPVIACNDGAAAEIVADALTDFLIPPDSLPELAKAVVALADKPGLRQLMGAQGIARVRERFEIRDTVRQTIDLCLAGAALPRT